MMWIDTDEPRDIVARAHYRLKKYGNLDVMDEELKERFIRLINDHTHSGECNSLEDEEKYFTGFACAAVQCGRHLNQAAPLSVINAYIEGESPFGFKYEALK